MAFEKAKTFLTECYRVLKITKKPSMSEFKSILKVTAIGMLIIGGIGFIVQLVKIIITSFF